MSTVAAETKSNLKPEVLALSEKITEGLAIDKKTGAASAKDDLYGSNLPEGLTIETVKQVQDYNTTFVAAGVHAFGKLAIDAMKSNKGLEESNVDIKMAGQDNLHVDVKRTKTYANRMAKEGEPTEVVKFGVVTATLEIAGAANAGQLKAARKELATLGLAALGK